MVVKYSSFGDVSIRLSRLLRWDIGTIKTMVVKYQHTTNRGEYTIDLEFRDEEAKKNWITEFMVLCCEISNLIEAYRFKDLDVDEFRRTAQEQVRCVRSFTEKWGKEKTPREIIRATRFLESYLNVPTDHRVFGDVLFCHKMARSKKRKLDDTTEETPLCEEDEITSCLVDRKSVV